MEIALESSGSSVSAFPEKFSECPEEDFELGLELLAREVGDAARRAARWSERVRFGLVALLGFLDDHREWASASLLQTWRDRHVAVRRERRLLDLIEGLLGKLDGPSAGWRRQADLTGELVAGGLLAVIRAQMHDEPDLPLVELTPELTAFALVSFRGRAAAQAERAGCATCEGFSVDRAVRPGGEGGRRVRRSIISRGKRSGGL